MNFIDQAVVRIKAGDGGDGRINFRQEKFISMGGPDGGDGGDGGSVIVKASYNQDSLAHYRYDRNLQAEAGQAGGKNKKHGRNGHDLILLVPVGTMAKDEAGEVLADLATDNQQVVLAKGGKGGFGNAHFTSSRRQSPNFADKGEPGEFKTISFELKMLADVGLVGLPNAGKSSLLRYISNAKPKVANYPFTTLNPSVGVVDVDSSSMLVADIPGLIEGASSGVGLGFDFLRHIERTAVIVHLIDIYSTDVVKDYLTIYQELAQYSPKLIKKPTVIALNKSESIDDTQLENIIDSLRRVVKPKSTPIIAISALSGKNVQLLLRQLMQIKHKADAKQAKNKQLFEYKLEQNDSLWQVSRINEKTFLVDSAQIKRFAIRTDFNNEQAVARMMDILKKRGILHDLLKKGLQPGDKIILSDVAEIKY